MGNYISCTLSVQTATRNTRLATKVVLPTSEIVQFFTPTNAAELMLETPNHFLVNSQSLKIGRRFSALNADEDLEEANVYVMFPMKRLNSVITASDLGTLFLISKRIETSTSTSSAGKGRVSPEYSIPAVQEEIGTDGPKLSLEGIEEFSRPDFVHRMSLSRSKRPLLETIAEETVYSR